MATFAYWTLRIFAPGPSGGMNPLSSSATSAKFRLDIAKVWVEFGLDAFPHKLSIHLVRDSVHLSVSLGISKKLCLRQPCLNKLMHVDRELKY